MSAPQESKSSGTGLRNTRLNPKAAEFTMFKSPGFVQSPPPSSLPGSAQRSFGSSPAPGLNRSIYNLQNYNNYGPVQQFDRMSRRGSLFMPEQASSPMEPVRRADSLPAWDLSSSLAFLPRHLQINRSQTARDWKTEKKQMVRQKKMRIDQYRDEEEAARGFSDDDDETYYPGQD